MCELCTFLQIRSHIKNVQDHYKRDYVKKHLTTNVHMFMTSCVNSTLILHSFMEQKSFFIKFSISIQVLQPGMKVLLRNSAQDGR